MSDLFGQTNHATQATSGNKPTYATSGINSHPAISFDGSNDYLQTPSVTLAAATVFLVLKVSSTTTFQGWFKHAATADTANSNGIVQYPAGASMVYGSSDPLGQWYHSFTSSISAGDSLVLQMQWGAAAGNLLVRKNQSTYTLGSISGTYAAPSGSLPLFFGAGYSTNRFQGYLGEAIVYNANLSSTQYTAIEQYLKAKWGTP